MQGSKKLVLTETGIELHYKIEKYDNQKRNFA